ncbi:MAG: PKD domain-containing protein, partial [Planctomycetota bacterium]
VDVDDQFLYKSLTAGDPNNGWRGLRRWPDGKTWRLGVAHILRLLRPEHQPLPAGTHVAEGAAVWVWGHNHSHFTFSVQGPGGEEVHLDPWIVFRQIFENNRDGRGAIRASAELLGPQQTGEPVAFSARGSRKDPRARELTYCWTFGDGGFSTEPTPAHVFAAPGIYPVTLTVDDGTYRHSFTQHLTVDSPCVEEPVLALAAPDEVSFRRRPVHAMDAYGMPPAFNPHTLQFTARPSWPAPRPRTVRAENRGGGRLGEARVGGVDYEEGEGWLAVTAAQEAGGCAFRVEVSAEGLEPGLCGAEVAIECPGALNSPQSFRVELRVPHYDPPDVVVLDNAYPGFYATPCFWVGHRFHKGPPKGYNGFSLVNGRRARAGEFARFTPDLRPGTYEVFFPEIVSSWQEEAVRFAVRVRHKGGLDTVWMEPRRSPEVSIWEHMAPNPTKVVGTFEFAGGTDGYVEILAEGSEGQVPADAVIFRRLA